MPSKLLKDVRPIAAALYFLPIKTRVPLKFGPEITTEVTLARVRLTVRDAAGKTAVGWGETPLSVQWVWPSDLSYETRLGVLKQFCIELADAWAGFDHSGHPMEIGHAFIDQMLPGFDRSGMLDMPWLAALVCNSAFDLALHDAYGVLHGVPTYETYNADYMNHDLSGYLTPAEGSGVSFEGKYPSDFLVSPPPSLLAWHLVGGKDPITPAELTGAEPDDGYPVLLRDWIRRDGLKCLKVKLRGDDPAWDYDRFVLVGQIADEEGALWLTADFN